MYDSRDLELYIHIPFCKKKCNYCDFVSFAGCEAQIGTYIDALCREIAQAAQRFQNRNIVSIYIGGGTPSILNCAQMEQLVESLTRAFQISETHEKKRGLFLQKKIRPKVEFSVECNPGTVDAEKLRTYRKLGINRLSIGLQSTDEEDLKTLGRIHTYEDFTRTFEQARAAGFDNLNVDLMQAIPGQTLSGWKRVLAVLATWMPEHISAYSLIIEEGTPFKRMFDAGQLPLPDEDTEREIYHYTKEFLESAGYRRYEISNYAKPGFECIHNIGYWQRRNYLGLGLHASSMIDNMRWKNTSDLRRYLEYFSQEKEMYMPSQSSEMLSPGSEMPEKDGSIFLKKAPGLSPKSCKENGSLPEPEKEMGDKPLERSKENSPFPKFVEELEQISHKEQMEEFMFLGLRMMDGVSKTDFLESFGQDLEFTYGEVLQKLSSLQLIENKDDRIRLTDKGVDVSNAVLAEFLL